MKRKWLVVSLLGFSLLSLQGAGYATVLDRPALFLELLQQNEQLSNTAVMLMTQYMEAPSAKDLAELKGLFRKMIGEQERNYLAANGFTIDDFVGGLDVIAQMPVEDKRQLLSALNLKSFKSAHTLLAKYDHAVIVGQEQIPLNDGSGSVQEPVNAKADFEQMLRSTYGNSMGLHHESNWASDHALWLVEEKGFDKTCLLNQNPNECISKREFQELLTYGFSSNSGTHFGLLENEPNEPIKRIEAMNLIFEVMQLKNSDEPKSLSSQFSDVQLLSESQQACVLALVSNQIVKGYNNGTLKPNQALSFGEAWAMIRLALD